MGCFSVLRAPPSPLGFLDDSSATEHRSYAKICTWGQEENKGKVSRAAAQDGHKQEVFFFPLAWQMQLWESHAPCWSVALPCQNRYPFGIAKPRRGYPVKVAVWSSLNKFCVSGNYHSVGQSTGRVAAGIPALQTEKKSVRAILIKDSNGSQKHVDDFFHVLMPLATSGIKRGEYQ